MDNKVETVVIGGDTITLDLGSYGAGQPTYNHYTGGGGGAIGSIDTITLDSSMYATGASVTIPSTYTWSQDYNTTWTTTDTTVQINSDGLTMKEGADIKIGGKSLSDAIEKIEARLGILNPNPELEERWEQLRDLRKQYMELEKDLLEKEKLMKILKEQ